MAADELLLQQTPRLASERIDLEGPTELRDMLLRSRDGGSPVRLSAFEYDIVRRLDGRRSLAEIQERLARDQRVDISTPALLSLLEQLARSGLLDGFRGQAELAAAADARLPTAPLPAAWHERVDRGEQALLNEEQRRSGRTGEVPAEVARAAERLLLAVTVDEGEVFALGQQAIEAIAMGDWRGAVSILQQAEQLAPEAAHLTAWAQAVQQALRERPQLAAAELWTRMVALAPGPASKLRAPAALRRPSAAHAAQGVVLLARAEPVGPTRAASPLGQDAPEAPALPPERGDAAAAALPLEGTLGLPTPAALAAHLPKGRRPRRLWWALAFVLCSAGAAAGYWLLRAPTLRGALVEPVPYRVLGPGRVAARTYPREGDVVAALGGRILRVAAVGSQVAAEAIVAELAPLPGQGSAELARLRRQVKQQTQQHERATRALGPIAADAADPWASRPARPALSPAARRRALRRLERLSATLQAAKRSLEGLEQTALASLALRSPFAGEVVSAAAKGARLGRLGVALRVRDQKLVRLHFVAPTTGGLHVGDAVRVVHVADGKVSLMGHVVEVEGAIQPPTGAVDRAARQAATGSQARILVDVMDASGQLLAAETRSLRLVVEEVPEAARVERSALRRDGEGHWLWVVDGRGRLGRLHCALLGVDGESVWLRWPPRASRRLQVVVDGRADRLAAGETVRLLTSSSWSRATEKERAQP